MREVMLTTIDNPYDPFTEFDEWFAYDEGKGYHTCQYLGRIARSTENFLMEDEQKYAEEAIDEIIKYNILGIYKKVVKEVNENLVD